MGVVPQGLLGRYGDRRPGSPSTAAVRKCARVARAWCAGGAGLPAVIAKALSPPLPMRETGTVRIHQTEDDKNRYAGAGADFRFEFLSSADVLFTKRSGPHNM